jgi:hypothetical protein
LSLLSLSQHTNRFKPKQDVIYTLKNCRVSAFEAQQAGFLAKAKDAWSCPDGVTRYMDVKYRDKTEVNKLRTEGK